MAVRKQQIETPYTPLPVGDLRGGVDLPSIEQELARVSAATGALFNGGASPSELAGMAGVPDSFTLGTTRQILQNYDLELISSTFGGEIDPASGTIQVIVPGLYRVTVSAMGDQGNNSFNEAAFCFLRRDAGTPQDFDLAGYEIPNNKTTSRSWNSARLINVTTVPETLSVGLYATSGLGTFAFTWASFDVSFYDLRTKE